MRITKYEHACFTVEIAGEVLVIDPGAFTSPLFDLTNVTAIVITHEHQDHWTPDQLTRILSKNPDARLFGAAGVAAAATDFDFTVVHGGDAETVGAFTLAFYGDEHAVIHSSIPVIDNVGVLINDTVFYPGDAFTVPPVAVDTLAVPSSAPWLKVAEVMDYVAAVKPKRAFPTHEMVNSVIGKNMTNERIASVLEANGGTFHPLETNETLEI